MTYENIMQVACDIKPKVKETEVIEEDINVFDSIVQALKSSLLILVLALTLGWGSRYLYHLTSLNLFEDIYLRTAGVVCIYFALCYGYNYGKQIHRSAPTNSIIAVMITILMSPFVSVERAYLEVPKSYLMVEYFEIEYLLLYVIIIVCSLVLFNLLMDIVKKKTPDVFNVVPTHTSTMLLSTIPSFIIISIVLIIKVIISLLIL